jgi:hypothetical protein
MISVAKGKGLRACQYLVHTLPCRRQFGSRQGIEDRTRERRHYYREVGLWEVNRKSRMTGNSEVTEPSPGNFRFADNTSETN